MAVGNGITLAKAYCHIMVTQQSKAEQDLNKDEPSVHRQPTSGKELPA